MTKRRSKAERPFIIAERLTLDEWIERVSVPEEQRDYIISGFRFPTTKHREQYLLTVQSRSDVEVRNLLRSFMMKSGGLGSDGQRLLDLLESYGDRFFPALDEVEFLRRLLRQQAWEGTTWVLDLLPDHPQEAIDILRAYWRAHMMFLPDGRADGLEDAEAVIRQKYMLKENSCDTLMSLTPPEFESLIANLFRRMGYDATTTRASKDGGIDVIARKTESGFAELVLVQCKRQVGNVGAPAVRELNGVVARMQANRGVFVTTSEFTSDAIREAQANSIIELIGFKNLNMMLNRHFGARWPMLLSYHTREPRLGSLGGVS